MAPTQPEREKTTRNLPRSDGSRPESLSKRPRPSDVDHVTPPPRPKRPKLLPIPKYREPSPPPQSREYECISTIGRGVLLVRKVDKDRPRLYAMKISPKAPLRRYEVDNSRQATENAAQRKDEKNRERRALVKMPWNPFIAGIIDAFDDQRNLYHVLELGIWGSFYDYIKDRKLHTAQCRFYFANIICGILFIHSRGIVHRDIKPENILIGGDGYLMLTDFGNSQLIDSKDPWDEMGTLNYLAPDCVDSLCAPEFATALDWWSAACILFEMATGEQAFPWISPYDISVEIRLRKFIKDAQYLWPVGLQVDEQLRQLVDSMLVPDVKQRFGSITLNAGRAEKAANLDLFTHDFLTKSRKNYMDAIRSRSWTPLWVSTSEPDPAREWFSNGVPFQEEVPSLRIVSPPIQQTYDIRTYYKYNRPDRVSDLYPDRDLY